MSALVKRAAGNRFYRITAIGLFPGTFLHSNGTWRGDVAANNLA
ncbi:MAG TPA: hypothetical protein V6D11_12680 [Waterburya sp.]